MEIVDEEVHRCRDQEAAELELVIEVQRLEHEVPFGPTYHDTREDTYFMEDDTRHSTPYTKYYFRPLYVGYPSIWKNIKNIFRK